MSKSTSQTPQPQEKILVFSFFNEYPSSYQKLKINLYVNDNKISKVKIKYDELEREINNSIGSHERYNIIIDDKKVTVKYYSKFWATNSTTEFSRQYTFEALEAERYLRLIERKASKDEIVEALKEILDYYKSGDFVVDHLIERTKKAIEWGWQAFSYDVKDEDEDEEISVIEIKEELETITDKIERILSEDLSKSIASVNRDEEGLKQLEQLLEEAHFLYKLSLELNENVFNSYEDLRESVHVGVTPSDVSEDVEDYYVDPFIRFIENLKDYDIEQLYDYVKDEMERRESEEEEEEEQEEESE